MTDLPSSPGVLVYGAGAVGCLLGGLLVDAGCRVTLLGRRAIGEPIRRNGLNVSLVDRHFTVHPRVIESASDLADEPDLIILATRAFGVEAAIPDLRRLAARRTTLLTVQNGIGAEELVAREMPRVRHVAGALTVSASAPAPGDVVSTSRSGGIALAPVSGDVDLRGIADRFSSSGIPTLLVRDYRSMKWSKLLLNMMANAIPAILGWSPGEVYRHPGMFRIERESVLEAVRVTRADGARPVSLPGFPVPVLPWIFRLPETFSRRLLLSSVEGGRGEKMPSLLLDLESGRERTEAGWLYGGVVNAGRRIGVPTPVNRRLLRIMEAVTPNSSLRDAFRGRPDLLARNVMLAAEAGKHPFPHRLE